VVKKNSFITLVPGNTCPDAKTLQVTFLKKMAAYKNIYYRGKQGILTEGEGSVQLTFSLRLVFIKHADLN
jgi:hypothetical protein